MIFKPEMVEKILAGEKTVTRRPVEFYWDETWEQTALAPCRYEVGKTYAVQPGRGKKRVGRIRIVDVRRGLNVLEDLADAQAEGFRRIEDFVNYWIALYGDYDSTQLVDRIEFELVEPNKQEGGQPMTDQPTDKGGVEWPEVVLSRYNPVEDPENYRVWHHANGSYEPTCEEAPYVPKHLYEQERERVEALSARSEHEQDLALAAHDRAEALEQKLGEVEAEKREAVIAWAEQREQLKEADAERGRPIEALEAEADALERQNLDGDGPADLTAATVRAVKAQGIRDALAALTSKPDPTQKGDE